MNKRSLLAIATIVSMAFALPPVWSSKFVQQGKDGSLQYTPDAEGNIIPDFSMVGYKTGNVALPTVAIKATVGASPNAEKEIQDAIDKLAATKPNASGFRGAVLLKAGTYNIKDRIKINASGIVLKGEGSKTVLIAAGTVNRPLIEVQGSGKLEVQGKKISVTNNYVPVGETSFTVSNAAGFKSGDRIILYRPGTDQWVKDLKMDRIEARNGTNQWQAKEYNLQYMRIITKIDGNRIFIDNPLVMPIESKYGGAEIYKYKFDGRISNVGIENLSCVSEFTSDTAENHSWDAIYMDKIEHSWVRNVSAKYFAYACVHLNEWASNITVLDCSCADHKSVITGGRRYSFCNEGQLNLFSGCDAADGRHDYVTQARTNGPNVFYNCKAIRTHADIGPHHRWSSGTLYDNISTDGEINIQDRGNYGSGHGWVGTTQVLWNCKVKKAAVQSPWVSGKNYCIGLKGDKAPGRFKDRPDGEWEGQNQNGLSPASLYQAQLKARK